ncbi:hypothetical protein C3473_29620, partial [Mycobacterium kansasii]
MEIGRDGRSKLKPRSVPGMLKWIVVPPVEPRRVKWAFTGMPVVLPPTPCRVMGLTVMAAMWPVMGMSSLPPSPRV